VQGLAAAVVLMAILLGVLVVVAFDVYCLVKVAASDRVRFLPKLVWAVAIVCVSPLGGLVYLLSQHLPRRSPDLRLASR
jgi:purine-cytosine permease-like protein